MTMTTYLFGLWLAMSGLTRMLPGQLHAGLRIGLLGLAPVLLLLSVTLQGWFPALMVLCAVLVMEPAPLIWAFGRLQVVIQARRRPAQAPA